MSLDWWQKTVIYQVYLTSFKDSSNNGRGDFRGLLSKLDYFDYLKVNTLLLSPFNPSPMKDNGYDITDYVDVDPSFGTLEDFDIFMSKAGKRGINILINFVANHTSDEHIWFTKSVQNVEPYADYYVWVDPKVGCDGIEPPNNWISVFGGSAWTWNEEREQYYLHQFLPEQPDLNLRSPYVREELKKVLIFWLQKGVDGFRIDAASHLFEDEDFRDEPVLEDTLAKPDEYEYLDHIYTKGHPENLEILSEWRSVLDDYSQKTGKHKIMLTETYEDFESTMRYYGSEENPISDIPLNCDLLELNFATSATHLYKIVTRWPAAMPPGKYPNWILGSHDHSRLATRVTPALIDGLHMVILLSKGVVICYYGDELGMEDIIIEPEDIQDSCALRNCIENSRDPSRSPMQWNDEVNAGFTEFSKPWLPIHENYTTVNVAFEISQCNSHLQIFQKIVKLKEEPAIQLGSQEYPLLSRDIFSMARVLKNSKSFLVVWNMGSDACNANFSGTAVYLPESAELEIWSKTTTSDKIADAEKDLSSLSLQPKEAIVLSFFPRDF